MAKGLIEHSTLTAIADAIRAKTDSTDTMLPSEMAALITGVAGYPDGITEMEYATLTLSSNTNYSVTVPTSMANGNVNAAVIAKSKNSSYSTSIHAYFASKSPLLSITSDANGNSDGSASCNAIISDGVCKLTNASNVMYLWPKNTYYVLLWR